MTESTSVAPALDMLMSTPETVDDVTLSEITGTIQELLNCANAGRLLDGFALYSPNYLGRFMSEQGLTPESLRAKCGAARPPTRAHIELDAVLAAGSLPGGAVWITVRYREGFSSGNPVGERYTLIWDSQRERWLIEDIVAVEQPARADAVEKPRASQEAAGATGDPANSAQRTAERPRARGLPMLVNSLALIMGKLATMGLGFLAWMVAARYFSQSEVGLASGVVSATMLCVQIALFGAGAALISLYPHHQRQPNRLLDTAITSVILFAGVAGASFVLLASGVFRELRIVAERPSYAAIFLIMAVAGTLGVLFDQLATALRRGDYVLVRGMVSGLLTVALVISLPRVAGFESAVGILTAWAAASVSMVAIGWLQLRRALPRYRFRPRLHWDLAQEQARVGFPNWVLTLAERAPGAVLPIVVTELLSPRDNAAWYSAWMMAWVVYVVPVQVGLNLFAEASHKPESMSEAVRHSVLTSLAVGALAAAGSAVVGPILLGFLGQGYADLGTTPLRILVLAVVPFTFVQAYFSVCRARNELAEAIVVGILAGSVGVGAAAVAGISHGLIGMAVAWLAVQSVAGAWALYRLQGLMRQSDYELARERASIPAANNLAGRMPAGDPATFA